MTLLGRMQASDDVMQSVGRWTSKAFLRYIKKGRVGRLAHQQVPLSGNAGINADDFPAPTDGMGHILDLMWRAGPGCCFTKADWADAYKHIHIREEDVRLQVMQWGKIFFVDNIINLSVRNIV